MPRRCVLDSGRGVCVILLELLMPEMDGFACAEELHKHTAWRSLPIVIMTNKDIMTEDCQRLHGLMETALRKGEHSRGELLSEVRSLGTAYTRHKAPRGTVQVNRL